MVTRVRAMGHKRRGGQRGGGGVNVRRVTNRMFAGRVITSTEVSPGWRIARK